VPTQEEAADALDRIEGGEGFAAIAEEVSIDPGSGPEGGDLDCSSVAGFVPEFAEVAMSAEIGEITEPVETQFGFHIIRVDSRELATAVEIRQSMLDGRIETAVSDWYLDTLAAADVTVVREFGTWMQSPTPHVEPP
jgi:parvulin-like peptidyl-prolyl isomerase